MSYRYILFLHFHKWLLLLTLVHYLLWYIDICRNIDVDICRIPCESLLIIKREHLKEDISDIMASFLEYDTTKSPLVYCMYCMCLYALPAICILCLNHKQSDKKICLL